MSISARQRIAATVDSAQSERARCGRSRCAGALDSNELLSNGRDTPYNTIELEGEGKVTDEQGWWRRNSTRGLLPD